MRQDPRFPSLYIVDHPLIQHKLSHMRDRDTSSRTFRDLLREITLLMGYEVTRDTPLTTRRITTPLTAMDAPVIAGRKGSGKSALFFQVRNKLREDKRNVVLDLHPEGFQLRKLKGLADKPDSRLTVEYGPSIFD